MNPPSEPPITCAFSTAAGFGPRKRSLNPKVVRQTGGFELGGMSYIPIVICDYPISMPHKFFGQTVRVFRYLSSNALHNQYRTIFRITHAFVGDTDTVGGNGTVRCIGFSLVCPPFRCHCEIPRKSISAIYHGAGAT
ncbi:hypothetical protein GGE12_006178 [Rhizobium mongolense]|uniref:Uncharacterized protein n=1 Tax=Rhizobium mongolense TaxID=57676 RepID=A0A7W6RTI0_9HYPH|nr:hypothetical protein [Rhizobium mongolense]